MPDIVTLTTGKIKGQASGDIVEFLGVPYAEPPVGGLRFAPPVPVKAWDGVLSATRNRPVAPQTPSRVFATMGTVDLPFDEDCLFLNIWAPENAKGPLPVIVWLHGGGFATGSASFPWYDGARLAREQGLIVVGVNYRLGALGYLSIPGIVEGNYALLDQELALRWVRDEIQAFGGDPANITVMGQSGGGHTIMSLLAVAGTEDLFQRAIIQSAPAGIAFFTKAEALNTAKLFLGELRLEPDTHDLLLALRALPVSEILKAQAAAMMKGGRMQEGDLRPALMPAETHPYTEGSQQDFVEIAARNAAARGIEILVGWAKDEANLFYAVFPLEVPTDAQGFAAKAAGIFPRPSADDLARAVGESAADPRQAYLTLVSNATFVTPSIRFADTVVRHGGRAHVYRFDWESPDPALKACHCIDLPFTFGNLDAWRGGTFLSGADGSEMEQMARAVMARWGAFARDGNPGFAVWSGDEHGMLHLDQASAAAVQ